MKTLNEHDPRKISCHKKGKTSDCKYGKGVNINQFFKGIRAGNLIFLPLTITKTLYSKDLRTLKIGALDETPAEDLTELIDKLSQFHLQVDNFSQKYAHQWETVTSKANLHLTNHVGHEQQRQSDNIGSTPVVTNNHQSKAVDDQEDQQGSLPAISAVLTATIATTYHYGIPFDLTFGPYLNTLVKKIWNLHSGLIGEVASTSSSATRHSATARRSRIYNKD